MENSDPLTIRNKITNEVLTHNYGNGPLLLLAGPGTGKTYSLLVTIKKHIDEGLRIDDFFEATLTNAAVEDFLKDARKEISESYNSSSTLHFRAKGILHRYAGSLGIDSGFTVIDQNIEDFIDHDLSKILNIKLSIVSTEMSKYQKASANCVLLESVFARLYSSLQKYFSAIDWYDIVSLTIRILEDNEEILETESNRFNFLLIDEYQDLNPADQKLIELLNNNRNNLILVGDDDQSIYSNRYADPSGIINLVNRYPTVKNINLPVTSRLPSRVVSASYKLIKRNENRSPKEELVPLDDINMRADGGFVISVNNKSDKAEKAFLCSALETLIAMEVPPDQILVLCNCRKLGNELFKDIYELNCNLPIKNELIREFSADDHYYLINSIQTFLSDPNNNLSLRIILGALSVDTQNSDSEFVKLAFNESLSLWDGINRDDLINNVPDLRELLLKIREIYNELAEIPQLEEKTRAFIETFERLHYLLELLVHDEEGDNEQTTNHEPIIEHIRFLTMHSSKGLDADFIFIPCLEESLSLPGSDEEEQRRLLYVALTRAKVGAIMSWAWSRQSNLRFKCSGHGGDVVKRKAFHLINECGVKNSLVPRSANKTSSQVAIDILKHHANISLTYDKEHNLTSEQDA